MECICPEKNDIALSKVCAWREKDKAWLKAGLETGVLDIEAIEARSRSISNPNAPEPTQAVLSHPTFASAAAVP